MRKGTPSASRRVPTNEEMQIVVIAGNDAAGALYGALDFKAFIVPAARQTHNHLHYRRQLFMGEALPRPFGCRRRRSVIAASGPGVM